MDVHGHYGNYYDTTDLVNGFRLCAADRLKEAKPLETAMHRFLYEALVPPEHSRTAATPSQIG